MASTIPESLLREVVAESRSFRLTQEGTVLWLDLDNRSAAPLCQLPEAAVDLGEQVSLHLPSNGALAAVVNPRGRFGIVLDLNTGRTTMSLDRRDYHNRHCVFPVAFCEIDDHLLLLHGTDWNRLDISDPIRGQLLTERTQAPSLRGEPRPEHYLDYFHCGLTVSPNQEYVVDNGWVWHPVGIVTTWNIRRWLHDNPWESEDGESKKSLCYRDYHWDGPLCWIGDDRLALWGYGNDDDWLIPAVRIFTATSGREERWFAGPKGQLVFDEYLFSAAADEGLSVWDASSGERLLQEASFCPRAYHRGAKAFLTLNEDGLVQMSRLRGRPVDRSWLSWGGGTVPRLARTISAERAFDHLPVLADALEEAGCRDSAILAHCRQAGPHAHRCWVLDFLLDAEGSP
jgi:hypothetical protein